MTAAENAQSAIDNYEIADGAVQTSKLEDKAVTTAKIADKAVTAAQLADGVIPVVPEVSGEIYMSKQTMENLCTTLSSILDGTLSTQYDGSSGSYIFTFVKNELPVKETE